jgi:hypothetical protein
VLAAQQGGGDDGADGRGDEHAERERGDAVERCHRSGIEGGCSFAAVAAAAKAKASAQHMPIDCRNADAGAQARIRSSLRASRRK